MKRHLHIANIRRTRDSRGGATLVEGAVGLWVLALTFVVSLLLLLNVGALTYYKMKLALVTTESAAYASSIATPSKCTWAHNQQVGADLTVLSAQATAYANTLLQQAGLVGSGTPPQVTVTYGPLSADTLSVNVNIKLTSLPLFGKGNVLPSFMSFQDCAFGIARYDQPPGLFCLYVPNTPPGLITHVYMPGYGWAPGGHAGMPPYDVMKLRSTYFATTPQTILLAIPSTGAVGECWDAGGTAMTNLAGTSY